MFLKPFSPFEEPKTNKSGFPSEPEVLPCFEMNYKSLERHKKTTFARDNKKGRKSCEHGPENGKQKFNFNDSSNIVGVRVTSRHKQARRFHVMLSNLMLS